MLQIIGQPLLAYLYLLLTTYPRLAGALALFVLVLLGAVIARAFSRIRRRRQEGYLNMAVPNGGFSESSHLAGGGGGGGSRQVKKTSSTTTAAAAAPAPADPVAPVAPRTPVLAPVTRTSSSSTSSSDLLLPPLPTNINSRGSSSSWPPVAPIPWRSSWGFLKEEEEEEDRVVVLDEGEEEDTATEQGHHAHEQHQHQQQQQQQQEEEEEEEEEVNNNFLALPTTGVRRTGSMEARKGSACTISGLGDIHGLSRLELGIPAPQDGNDADADADADADVDADADAGSPADLVGVGGQFQF